MTTSTILAGVGASICSIAGGVAAASESLTTGQQWTLLAVLAAVVLAVVGQIASSVRAMAKASAEQAIQIALLVQQLQRDRHDSIRVRDNQFKAVNAKLDELRAITDALLKKAS
jgi:hypothetical protein